MKTPSLSIKELFRLAFSEPVLWLSEPQNEHPRLNWVVTSVEEAQQGDILLLTTISDAVKELQRAHQIGTAAVIFLGNESPSEKMLPAGLAVVAIPGRQDAQTIQKLLLTALINQRVALVEQGVRIHVQLSEIEAEGQGIAGLVNAMANISGLGVVVQDKRLSISAQQAPGELKRSWDKILTSLTNLEKSARIATRPQTGSLAFRDCGTGIDGGFFPSCGTHHRGGYGTWIPVPDWGKRGNGCTRQPGGGTGGLGVRGGNVAHQGGAGSGKAIKRRSLECPTAGEPQPTGCTALGSEHGAGPFRGARCNAVCLDGYRHAFPPSAGDTDQRRGNPPGA